MRIKIRYSFFVFLLSGLIHPVSGRSNDTIAITLSLRNVVDLAILQSASVKYAQNTNVNYYWRWKNFQSSFRPQLILTGEVPNFTQQNIPVVQPDGSIEIGRASCRERV